MIRTSRSILIALVLLAGTGCERIRRVIVGPPQAPLYRYRLAIPPTVADAAPSRAGSLPGSLAIGPYVTRGIYGRSGIVYRVDDVRLETYPSREWAIPLRDMLGEFTEAVLEANPLTTETATFDPRTPRSYAYQWRGTVLEFEEVNRGSDVLAAVHLEAELIRTANDSVVWSGAERIERAVPAPTDSMPRVIETLSGLTAEVLTRLVERARTAAVLPTAAAAPPPR